MALSTSARGNTRISARLRVPESVLELRRVVPGHGRAINRSPSCAKGVLSALGTAWSIGVRRVCDPSRRARHPHVLRCSSKRAAPRSEAATSLRPFGDVSPPRPFADERRGTQATRHRASRYTTGCRCHRTVADDTERAPVSPDDRWAVTSRPALPLIPVTSAGDRRLR